MISGVSDRWQVQGLYMDPRTSNSGTDMHKFFVDWPLGLRMRADGAFNGADGGGRFGRNLNQQKGGTFRMTLSGYGSDREDGIAALMEHQPFHAAARDMMRGERPLIDPAVAFGNLMIPGEHQGIHTDVPEFRGKDTTVPATP